MKKTMIILSILLSTLFLSGCGSDTSSNLTEQESIKQPHDASKLNRKKSTNQDWSWNVGAKLTDDVFYTDFYDGFPDEIKHRQYFIDADNDVTTGYQGANGWEITGADYIIEDRQVYKSLSSTEWRWEYVGKFRNFELTKAPQGATNVPKKQIMMDLPSFDVKSVFKNDTFKVMIEVYDQNWSGNYHTVTDIEAKVNETPLDPYRKVNVGQLYHMILNDQNYSKVDVSEIANMSYLFYNKEIKYDISGWDVSGATNMRKMFFDAKSFNQPIGDWDVSSVTDMRDMFGKVTSFNQDISGWNVSSVDKDKHTGFGAPNLIDEYRPKFNQN